MKKLYGILILSALLAACNNEGGIKVKMDSLGKKFDSSAEKIWDSTKEKGKALKEKIKNKMEQKDTAH